MTTLSLPARLAAQDAKALSPEASAYLDHALRIMEARALRRADVDWEQIRAAAFAAAAGARTTRDTYPAIFRALYSLGDHHSHFRPPLSALPEQLRMVLATRPVPQPDGHRIGETVGYIRVPAFSGPDPAGFARSILDLVAEVDGPRVCGWVVDVRGNTGGNMWPMVQGLSPILGDGVAGYFVRPGGAWDPWIVDMRGLPARRLVRPNPPVAVLQDTATASSGEAVVVVFRGRAGVRTFGQPTNGLSTGNVSIQLADSAVMILTTSVFADRSGRIYGGVIDPDELIPDSASDEEVLHAATEWLHRQPACVANIDSDMAVRFFPSPLQLLGIQIRFQAYAGHDLSAGEAGHTAIHIVVAQSRLDAVVLKTQSDLQPHEIDLVGSE